MTKKLLIGICVVSSLSSCQKSVHSQASSLSDSTSIVVYDKDLSPLLEYELKELGDFPTLPAGDLIFPSMNNTPPLTNNFNFKDSRYLHFLNGKKMDEKKKEKVLRKLKWNDIESLEFISGEEAAELYGEKAAYGVVIMRTKKQ